MDTWTKYIKQVSSNIREIKNRTLISETKETKVKDSTISSALYLESISGPQWRKKNKKNMAILVAWGERDHSLERWRYLDFAGQTTKDHIETEKDIWNLKMVMITLYAKQKKRHRCTEQSFGLCGRRQGCYVSRQQHQNMYII